MFAAAVVILWAVSGPLFGFSDTWELVIKTGITIVTFLMVFLMQNSQNRNSAAIQAKLDELIGSAPHGTRRRHRTARDEAALFSSLTGVTSTPWARLPVTRSRVFDLVLLGPYIDDRLGNPCERLVGIFFFLQRSFEEIDRLAVP